MKITIPPGKILQYWLIQAGIGQHPTTTPTGAWKVYSPFMPDSADQAIAVANTSPVLDGTILKTGESIQHPGIQVKIRCRGDDHDFGYAKGLAVEKALTETLKRATVVVGAKTFLLSKFTLSAGLTFVGLEEQGKRPWWVINGTITVSEV